MVIIIEGVDRVGKTTLANMISKKYHIPIFKQERIEKGTLTALGKIGNYYENYIRAKSLVEFWNSDSFTQDIIIDRFHWTEAVYSWVDRDAKVPAELMLYTYDSVQRLMSKKRDKYIIIYVKPTDIEWSSQQHGKDLRRHNDMFEVVRNYSVCDNVLTPNNIIDCTYNEFEDVLDTLYNYLLRW